MAWARAAEQHTEGAASLEQVQVHPFAGCVVWPIATVVALAHLVAAVAGRNGYWFDEVYMLAIGRDHLDFGSADQPPIAPLLAALSDVVAPGSVVVLRLPAIAATVAGVVLAALIARELDGDRRAQGMAAAAQATSISAALFGHWLTPYTLEPAQWLLLLWLFVRWVRLRDDRLLLFVGVVAGIAAETKFQSLLLCGSLVVGVLVCGPRDVLRRRMFWAGVAVGAVITAPTLVWQARHGWPQLLMSEVVAEEAEVLYGGRASVTIQMLVWAGVAGTVLVLLGLWWLLHDREFRHYRFLAVAFLALLIVFTVTAGRPYYLTGFHGALIAVGAVGLQRRRERGLDRWSWTVWPAFAVSAVVAGIMLAASVGFSNSDVGERIADTTAAAYRELPPDGRDRTAVIGQSYIIAAYLDGYAATVDLPSAHSPNRAYGYFPLPDDSQTDVLFAGTDPSALAPFFTEVTQLRAPVSDEIDTRVWLLSGRTEAWSGIWPQVQTLRVG
ncbi:dolichyl-phosphate-mannose-protein mannosyltransferase [Rhodococcus sp. SMB37]|uniref:glycosyltransferase family 39 protein n=1 Tax=Rhodococcus sp. SMB37 TaxID=2512213 RepID=UPI0010451246|nr:glycosyltransferase family 39 protein [Rhodococcus sp. SMB37]TCN50356.1 dolichyl-phosphate-mannose-protein mannosyltransferase [Rhodococcus sp. SMB37]